MAEIEAPTDPAEYLAALKALEGQEVAPPFTAADPVNQAMIRHWVEAIGDYNPIYVDDDAARANGREGVVAPAAMLQVWTMHGLRAHGEPAAPDSARARLFALLEQRGFTSVVATNCEQTYMRELRPGDLITVHEVITDVSAEKNTGLGRGHFITSRMTFTDAGGEVVGTQDWRILRFAPHPKAPQRPPRPRPSTNRDNQFFFDAAAEHRLLIQRCSSCGELRHPPGPMCPSCHSLDWDTVQSSGKGTVYSFVVNHYPQVPAFEYPLLVALVELEEGTRLVSNLVEVDPADVTIGMPVELRWLDAGDGLVLPQFAPAGSGG